MRRQHAAIAAELLAARPKERPTYEYGIEYAAWSTAVTAVANALDDTTRPFDSVAFRAASGQFSAIDDLARWRRVVHDVVAERMGADLPSGTLDAGDLCPGSGKVAVEKRQSRFGHRFGRCGDCGRIVAATGVACRLFRHGPTAVQQREFPQWDDWEVVP